MLYISHDLASVASVCHRVAILNQGEIVECGAVDEVFSNPRSGFTRELIAAIPRVPGVGALVGVGGAVRLGREYLAADERR